MFLISMVCNVFKKLIGDAASITTFSKNAKSEVYPSVEPSTIANHTAHKFGRKVVMLCDAHGQAETDINNNPTVYIEKWNDLKITNKFCLQHLYYTKIMDEKVHFNLILPIATKLTSWMTKKLLHTSPS